MSLTTIAKGDVGDVVGESNIAFCDVSMAFSVTFSATVTKLIKSQKRGMLSIILY